MVFKSRNIGLVTPIFFVYIFKKNSGSKYPKNELFDFNKGSADANVHVDAVVL